MKLDLLRLFKEITGFFLAFKNGDRVFPILHIDCFAAYVFRIFSDFQRRCSKKV